MNYIVGFLEYQNYVSSKSGCSQAFERHRNRILAMSFVEQRKLKQQGSSNVATRATTIEGEHPIFAKTSNSKLTIEIGAAKL